MKEELIAFPSPIFCTIAISTQYRVSPKIFVINLFTEARLIWYLWSWVNHCILKFTADQTGKSYYVWLTHFRPSVFSLYQIHHQSISNLNISSPCFWKLKHTFCDQTERVSSSGGEGGSVGNVGSVGITWPGGKGGLRGRDTSQTVSIEKVSLISWQYNRYNTTRNTTHRYHTTIF